MARSKPANIIVIKKSPGAPTGLRWHWFRWCFLNSKLKNYYELIYDYTGDGYDLYDPDIGTISQKKSGYRAVMIGKFFP